MRSGTDNEAALIAPDLPDGAPRDPAGRGPAATVAPPAEWWERPGLSYDSVGCLRLGGQRLTDLAERTGTPAYIYSGERIAANVARLQAALATIGSPAPRLSYAMKSNRHAAVLRQMRGLGVGLDVCSPGEVRYALAAGFSLGELSFTAGSLDRKDLVALAEWPALWINVDSLSALRQLAHVSPGRTVGLRINPGTGVGYRSNALLRYAGEKPTKFGVYLDRFAEALALARELGLTVAGLHCHSGCGYLTPDLADVEQVFDRIGAFLDAAPAIRRLNLGGGLGIPLVAGDATLDLTAWAAQVRRHFGRRGVALEFEPGDYLVKDAGVLLTEVTQVEEKGGRVFVGLNAGCNVHPEPAYYHLPLAPAPARRRGGKPQVVTLVGNINEALDVWAEDVALPPLAERDVLCLLNAGGYGASMASAHCLRTEFSEHYLPPPEPLPPESLGEANRRAWDELYRSTPELVWGAAPLPFLADFIPDFRRVLRPPSRLLDAGAGEGRNLGVLLRCGAGELHALDSSGSALAKIPAEIRAQVRCRQADLRATGYPEASFDGIAILDAIETLPDSAAVLTELARILKPGGLLLCNIPGLDDGIAGTDMQAIGQNAFLYRHSYYFQFLEQPAAEALLTRAGFEILRSGAYQWCEGPHPGFRAETHGHTSQVFLARRPVRIG